MEPSTQPAIDTCQGPSHQEGHHPPNPRIRWNWKPEELSESEIIPLVFVPKHSRKTLQQIDEEFLKTKRYKDLGVWFTNGLIEGFDVWFPWRKGPWPEHKYLFMRSTHEQKRKNNYELRGHWSLNNGKFYKSWGTKARDRLEAYYNYLHWVSDDFTKERIDDNYNYEYESQYCDYANNKYEITDFVREEEGMSFLEKYAKRVCYANVMGALETPTAPELYKKTQWSPIEIFFEVANDIPELYSIDVFDLEDFKWY